MGKIFCLMGKSASGKDTIYNQLLAMQRPPLKRVVPYTTRPIRVGEKEGETYFFCTEDEAKALGEAGKIIELRSYQTVHGVWKYFTANDGQIRLDTDNYLLIGTLKTYQKLCEYFGAERVCPVYIWVDDETRLWRAMERERRQKEPKYEEMCRRFLADGQDFSEEKLKEAGIRIRFENDKSETVLQQIAAYIESCVRRE